MNRLLPIALLLGCTPQFEDAPWRVDETRILAIVSEPPEAEPNTNVMLTALVASPDGTVVAPPRWSVCTRPRTASERTAVTQRCLEGESLEPVSASMSVLSDACARFGPNVPPAEGDATPQRPSDPDPSGGYFLPLRAETSEATAFGAVRIRCDLPGVTRRIFDAFEERYQTNVNPTLEAVTIDGDVVGEDDVVVVSGGDMVEIAVRPGLDAAEPYVRYDAPRGVLVEEREWLRVQWFVTDGTLDQGLAFVSDGESVSARWTAPVGPDRIHGWAVVTDARGGSSWQAFALDVE